MVYQRYIERLRKRSNVNRRPTFDNYARIILFQVEKLRNRDTMRLYYDGRNASIVMKALQGVRKFSR
eukprot:CFRG8193T1